jgi:membrane protein implicated in regulation of membrane protease activity
VTTLQREPAERLETKEFVAHTETLTMALLIIMAFGVIAGVILAGFGVVLVFHGAANATSSIHLFGQTIDTTSVGVACVAIGAVVVVVTIRRVLESLDLLSDLFKRKREP